MTSDARRPADLALGWLIGALLGGIAAVGLLLWEFLVLGLARVAVAPAGVRPALFAGYALVGVVTGLVAAGGGARGPRWATAAAWSALGWICAPGVAAVVEVLGIPGLVGVLVSIGAGTGLGTALGSVRASAWLHLGLASWMWCSLALIAPLFHHLLAAPNPESLAATGLAVGFAFALGAFTAAFAVEGRWPWVPIVSWTALGGLLFGLIGLRPEPEVAEPTLDVDPIVIVVVSGLRADHTGLGETDPSATPNLDAFGDEALVFARAYATSNWSVPSLASLLTGRLPYRHRAGHHDGERQRHTALSVAAATLPATLRRTGLATAAFVGEPRLRLYGLERGFDRWEEGPDKGAFPALWPIVEATGLAPVDWSRIAHAQQVTDRALAWIERQPDTGWLLLVQYADAGQFELDDPYGDTVREVDHQLGRLLDALPADAWVVVTGDRGRGLGEARPEMLRTARDVPFGHHAYDELLHVPLALRLPTQFPGRVDAPVSIVDVAPTLLAAMNHAPLPRADGVPLEPVFGLPLADRVVLAQSGRWGPELQAVVAFEHKLMVTRDGRTRLYDLRSDPVERQPLPLGLEHDDLLRKLLSAVPPPGGSEPHEESPWSRTGQVGSRLLGRR